MSANNAAANQRRTRKGTRRETTWPSSTAGTSAASMPSVVPATTGQLPLQNESVTARPPIRQHAVRQGGDFVELLLTEHDFPQGAPAVAKGRRLLDYLTPLLLGAGEVPHFAVDHTARLCRVRKPQIPMTMLLV